MLSTLRGKMIVSALIGLVVVIVLGLAGDIRQVGQSFITFSNLIPCGPGISKSLSFTAITLVHNPAN